MCRWILFTAALLVGPVAGALGDVEPSSSLLLYPGSTIQLDQHGRCAVLVNTSDMLVFVPMQDGAWQDFLEGGYSAFRVEKCGAA